MKNILGIAALLLVLGNPLLAQSTAKPEAEISPDFTGLYSFVHEGEFVQIEVNNGKVTGLVSRFKKEDIEKSEFVDQFFDEAKLEGTTLSFRTKPLDGVSYEFTGEVERGPAKTLADEGYWMVKGILTVRHSTTDGKVTEKTHPLTLKSFPEDAESSPAPGTKNTESGEQGATKKE